MLINMLLADAYKAANPGGAFTFLDADWLFPQKWRYGQLLMLASALVLSFHCFYERMLKFNLCLIKIVSCVFRAGLEYSQCF